MAMVEGDVWFNMQKTTLHIERTKSRYWCGMPRAEKHRQYDDRTYQFTEKELAIERGIDSHFCDRCVKIKMQWAWKEK